MRRVGRLSIRLVCVDATRGNARRARAGPVDSRSWFREGKSPSRCGAGKRTRSLDWRDAVPEPELMNAHAAKGIGEQRFADSPWNKTEVESWLRERIVAAAHGEWHAYGLAYCE